MLRILIADDHCIFRQALRVLLEREGFEVVEDAADGREAVRLAQNLRPDVAVLDFSMPFLNGLEAAREMQHVSELTRTVLLTIHREDHYVLGALRAGVRGYVVKTQAATDLLHAVRDVTRGHIYLSPEVSRAVVEAYLTKTDLPTDPLTSRERQVLQLVAEGNTTKEIGRLLGVSGKTAETHRGRIMEKLSVHNTAGLVRYAVRNGVIEL
jgi:DNA-binding NarL/FixJ family response regulator